METFELHVKTVPHNGDGRTRDEIYHLSLGHVATFFHDSNPSPQVTFTGLTWGKLFSRIALAGNGAKYGSPRYGLAFAEQLAKSATIEDALECVRERLQRVHLYVTPQETW